MANISIAISTCNSAGYLRECLTQLLNQSVISDCEIIVIDSGSDQDEASVCREFSSKFGSFIYERTPRETLYAAWNRALEIATGDFFVNANTDDALRPDALGILSRALEGNPEAALAYGDWIWSPEPNAVFPWNPSYRRIKHEAYHPQLALFYAYAGCHQFWRKSKLLALGGFNSKRVASGDYEALCRLVPLRLSAVYVPMALSAFYQNPKGLSLSSERSYLEFQEIRNGFRGGLKISDFFEVNEDDPKSCADAWVALAQYALDLYVPWAPAPTPDLPFAEECLRRAVAIQPRHAFARELMQKVRADGGREKAYELICRHIDQLKTRIGLKREFVGPNARTASPIFRN